MTQEQLAEAVDMSSAQLSRVETGLQGYTQDLLEAIAHALRTDVHSLLFRHPEDTETIFPLWNEAKPGQRRQLVEIAKTLIKPGN